MNKYKLKDVCKIEKGKIGITKAIEGEYPLVVTAEERSSHNEWHFDEPAAIVPLVSSTGHGHASIKRLHYAEGKYAVGSILATLIPKDQKFLDAKYLYVYLTINKEELLVSQMTGAANVSLTLTKLKEVEVEIPDYKTQLNIVKRYDESKKLNEKLTIEIKKREELVKQLRSNILQDAISGKLSEQWRKENPDIESAELLLEKIKEKLIKEGKIKKQKSLPPIKDEEIPFELPEGWVWCRLGEIIELVSGRDLKSPEYNDLGAGIPYITGASNFQDGELSIERWTENPKTISIRNDLLITCKGTIGEMAFNEHGELHIARQVMAIRTVINAISKYIQNIVYVNVDELNLQAKSLIPGISRDDVLNMLCPLPPLLEQENIVKRCSHLFNKLNKLDLINETIEEEIDFLNKIVFRDLFEE